MKKGLTALMLIARYPEQYEIAELLIKNKAKVNEICERGFSSLAYCIHYNN